MRISPPPSLQPVNFLPLNSQRAKIPGTGLLTLPFYVSGEMIDKLTLTYNRTRQAVITKELIEIISGAAALD